MRQPVRLRLIMAGLLVAASAVPNLGNSINKFSSVLNFYRLAVVILALFTLIIYRGEVRISGRRSFVLWMGFLLAWLIYGVVLLGLSPYADINRGSRELFSILCGLFSFYILSNLRLTEEEIEKVFRVLFWVLVAMIILGFYEIITANHLSSSMFEDPENEVAWRVDPHSATGIMYNVNDFSALITLMLPVVIGRYRIRLRRTYIDPGWILIFCVVFINRVNDANTCNLAILFGMFLYVLFQVNYDRRKKGLLIAFALVAVALLLVLYFTNKESDGMLVSRTMELVKDSSEGHGSLHSRMILYRNAILAGWRSGFLGLGPGGFSTFYTENPEDTDLINPHSLLMEILSQYGLVILVLFLGLLIYLIRRMIRMYHEFEQENIREWGRMGVIWIASYLITSFASSSYLPNSFHWTLIALICLMLETVRERYGFDAKGSISNDRMEGEFYEGLSSDKCASAGGYSDLS